MYIIFAKLNSHSYFKYLNSHKLNVCNISMCLFYHNKYLTISLFHYIDKKNFTLILK